MQRTESNDRVAVLIDAENLSSDYIDEILNEAATFGRLTIKRIYGDFTKQIKQGDSLLLQGWVDVAVDHSLNLIQQNSYTRKKNSSDSVLIIDAMDIMYGGNVDAFCIVSNDSDFTRLAMRIAETGMEVIGMGTKDMAGSFKNACTVYRELVGEKEAPAPKRQTEAGAERTMTPRSSRDRQPKRRVIQAIRTAIDSFDTDNSGWVRISRIGQFLNNRYPDFDPRKWGAKTSKLLDFLMQLDEFEVRNRKVNTPEAPDYWIRIKKGN
ncbi:MAG: NYN domain-containing protein [Clostridiales Family XIII bacterium]|jgi:uncharacterized LabA/DUF88 family protein/Fe-S-cluster formation regulator IscX/YfhJ|nr:NYN domain-containing protein [Clostridiales Family XIII bacterium]